jgi:hypothetical protein
MASIFRQKYPQVKLKSSDVEIINRKSKKIRKRDSNGTV